MTDRTSSNADATGTTILVYLVWFFFGLFGAHRFVAGRVGSGFAMLALNGFGWLTFWFGLGFVLWGVLGLWWLIDVLLIPGMVRGR